MNSDVKGQVEKVRSVLEDAQRIYTNNPVDAINIFPDVIGTCLDLLDQIESTDDN